MSLLMDALKRAEEARRARAQEKERQREESGGAEAEPEGFSFDLESTGERDARLGERREDAAPEQPAPASVPSGEGFELSPPGGEAPPPERRDPTQTDLSDTLPSMRRAQESVRDYFEDTGARTGQTRDEDLAPTREGRRRDDEDRSPTRESRRRDDEDDVELQQTAQTVFDAKRVRRRRSARVWLAYAMIPVLLVVLGGVVYYSWSMLASEPTLVRRSVPPASVTEPAPAPAARPAPSTEAAAPDAVETGPQGGTASEAPDATSARADTAADEPPASDVPAFGSFSAAELAAAEDALEQAPAPESAGTSETQAAAPAPPEEPAETLASAADASFPVLEPEPRRTISIARNSARQDQVHPLLSQAYQDLQAGRDAQAQAKYREVLAQEPRNRDALLGLAAIALREGREGEAARLYMGVLESNPRDSVAQAALVSLRAGADPSAAESRLKLLLRQEPEAAHLHFSLGNLYAARSRWPEAQRAYFEAYRVDNDNPDYAFNLAVSLDHLGKRRAALEFYRRALALAQTQEAGFDRNAARTRVQALSGQSQPES